MTRSTGSGIRVTLEVEGAGVATFADFVAPAVDEPPTVTLSRGTNRGAELWAWHDATASGDGGAGRRRCSVVVSAADGSPLTRYDVEEAWPSKLEISSRGAVGDQVLIETATIVGSRVTVAA